MTTFTPPTEFGEARGNPDVLDPAERLMSFYDPVLAGITVWQDQSNNWHQNQFPYDGRPDSPGLRQAQRVFLGGHTYDVDSATETALIAAGYGPYLNTAVVDHTWFKPAALSKFTRWAMTVVDPSATYSLSVDSSENLVAREDNGPEQFRSNNRNFWIHSDTNYNADFDATVTLDPTNYEGEGQIAEQAGVVLRAQNIAGVQTGITINNNIFFFAPQINIGIWKANEDGTGFISRGASIAAMGLVDFPHVYDIKLTGNIITVRGYTPSTPKPSWSDPTFAKTINLDTEAGDPSASPTPVGEGKAGLIAAHLGYSPLVNARYRGFKVGPRGSLFPDV
jgi:hypothetical protein